MIFPISLFEIISTVASVQFFFFFWMASYVADDVALNRRGTKTFIMNGGRTFFINSKSVVINCWRKLKNPPSWQIVIIVISFKKIPLFPNKLIYFIISFISLFVSIVLELSEGPILCIFFLPNALRSGFTNLSLLSANSETNFFASFHGRLITYPSRSIRFNGGLPKCTILDSWVFEKFVLANERFPKLSQILGACVLVNK